MKAHAMDKTVDVALGILTRPAPSGEPSGGHSGGDVPGRRVQILITRRPATTVYGGYWELPGGKIEPEESPQAAMVREMREELGVEVAPGRALDVVSHTYPHARVRLHPYFCSRVGGELRDLAVAEHRWVYPEEIKSFTFPEANLPIIDQMLEILASPAEVEK